MTEILSDIKSALPIVGSLLDFFGVLLNRGKKVNFRNHPLFVRANLNKTNIMMYFTLSNKGKEIVFKDILCKHMDIFNFHAKTLCDKYIAGNVSSGEELYVESVKVLDGILQDLRTFYVNDDRYYQQEKKVLDLVMSKYNHWNQERQMDMVSRMSEICNSAFYPTLNNKMVAILDALMFAMNDTVSDANKTLNNINGDLKGLVFKGVEI